MVLCSRRCRVMARVSTPWMPTMPCSTSSSSRLRSERQLDGAAGGVADDVAGHPDAAGLGVVVVHAGVADVRRGLHHELAGVGGVGDGLLVAGHAGGEDRLAQGGSGGAVAGAAEDPAVLEDEHGGGGCCHCICDPVSSDTAVSDTAWDSVTSLLSTIGFCLRGCGDQILRAVRSRALSSARAGAEAGVQLAWRRASS